MKINKDTLRSKLDKKRKYIFKENAKKNEDDNSGKLLEEKNLNKKKKIMKIFLNDEKDKIYSSTRYRKFIETNNTNIVKNRKENFSSKSVVKFNSNTQSNKIKKNLKRFHDFNLPSIFNKNSNKEVSSYLNAKCNSPDLMDALYNQNGDYTPIVNIKKNFEIPDENKNTNLYKLSTNKINYNIDVNKIINDDFLQKVNKKINPINENNSLFSIEDLSDEEISPIIPKEKDSNENENYKQLIKNSYLKSEKNEKFHRNEKHKLTQNVPNHYNLNQLQPLSLTYRNFIKANNKAISSDMKHIETKIQKNYITFGAESQAGLIDVEKNITKINQDSFLIKENIFNENYYLFGVFDGHGTHGHKISKFSADFINDFIANKIFFDEIFEKIEQKRSENKNKNLEEDKINNKIENENKPEKQKSYLEKLFKLFIRKKQNLIKNSIIKLEKELSNTNYNISYSGSTLLTLFIMNDFLICYCIGDSKCLLFKNSENEQWSYVKLSTDHKPNIESEKNRIENKGGEIHPFYNEKGESEGDNRVWMKGKQYPGLSLTRAIGDNMAKKIGIISEPDFIIKKIDKRSKFIILGSDGLWDVLKPIDIIKIVKPFYKKNDPKSAANELIKKASKIWAKNNNERDDITVIVIFIRSNIY